jgi:hypothetical protein
MMWLRFLDYAGSRNLYKKALMQNTYPRSPVRDMRKTITVALIMIIATSGMLVLESSSAQSTPKPSAPEFTVSYVDYSYDVPPTYHIDEFTGRNVSNNNGYREDRQSVLFKIKNQPFTAYNDSSGNSINRYFNFRYRGHFGTEWHYYPFSEGGGGTMRYGCLFFSFTDEDPKIPQSGSDYTEKSFTLAFLFGENKPSIGSPVDFQVQAIVGHVDYVGDGYYRFVGVQGDWSPIETLTIGTNQVTVTASASPVPPNRNETETIQPNETPSIETPTSTPDPTTVATDKPYESTINPTDMNPSPSQQGIQTSAIEGFDWQTVIMAILALAVVILAVGLAMMWRKLPRK